MRTAYSRTRCLPHLVGASSVSLAPPQAAGLTHSAAPPLPTKPEGGFAGAPVRWASAPTGRLCGALARCGLRTQGLSALQPAVRWDFSRVSLNRALWAVLGAEFRVAFTDYSVVDLFGCGHEKTSFAAVLIPCNPPANNGSQGGQSHVSAPRRCTDASQPAGGVQTALQRETGGFHAFTHDSALPLSLFALVCANFSSVRNSFSRSRITYWIGLSV